MKKMLMGTFIGGFAAGCATILIAATASFTPQDAEPPAGLDPAAMEQMWAEAMEKYCTPSDEHAELARRVGSWNVMGEYFMAPDMPGNAFEGEATFMMLMDGRYLLQEFKSEFEGQPFQGAGLSAYDRIKEKYVGTWIDNMSTAIMHSEGVVRDGAIVFHGQMPDPMAGAYKRSKSVERMVDDDTFVMEMYEPAPNGDMYLSMKLKYSRAD